MTLTKRGFGALVWTLLTPLCCDDSSQEIINDPPQTPEPTFDVQAHGIPKIIEASYLEVEKIARVSRFRSSAGHDYSAEDDFEQCRCMKHYFVPREDVDASKLRIRSPFEAKVQRVQEEWAGQQIALQCVSHPAFVLTLFHVEPTEDWQAGQILEAGQQIGNHIGSETFSDVAVSVATPRGRRLVSYFDCLPDSLFGDYMKRGATKRDDFIISQQDRDSHPITPGEFNSPSDPIPAWFDFVE